MPDSEFDFSQLDPGKDNQTSRPKKGSRTAKHTKSHRRGKKKKSMPIGLIATFAALLIAIIGCVVAMLMREDPKPTASTNGVADQTVSIDKSYTVDELSPLEIDIRQLTQSDTTLRYQLSGAPKGASVTGDGNFTWTPSEQQGPRQYAIDVSASSDATNAVATTVVRLKVTVNEVNQPPEVKPVSPQMVDHQEGLHLHISATDPDTPQLPISFALGDGAPEGATINPQTGEFKWTPKPDETNQSYVITVKVTEAGQDGLASTLQFPVRLDQAEQPDEKTLASELGSFEMPEVDSSEQQKMDSLAGVAPQVPDQEYGDDTILKLYRDRELFKPQQYAVLRKIYATRFENEHQDEIRVALGADYQEAKTWFDEHVDIKEELFTALDPDFDEIGGAVSMFDEIRKEHPEQVVSHAPLAIATAVVWDDGKGVYQYQGHQRRTKSTMPDGLLSGLENFQYFLSAESIMQGRGRLLPWEFLIHIINHPTPAPERQWAVANYLPKRVMFGKCYHDVPYDGQMLSTGGEITRLDGKPYTLPNLQQYGGVCAMQADFASRVGKSLGVPAAYVSGQGRFGGSHAWVMWVELQSVTAAGIQFMLKSHGRYRGDHYYVGNLKDPQTGQRMTDRQLELRLQTVGIGPLEKRQSDWLMKLFPMVAETEELDVVERIKYLEQVLRICPLNEGAWRALADMSRGGLITKEYEKLMMANMNGLFTSFANFPDFTWDVFDDLIAFQESAKKRDLLYGQLVRMYEAAGRPDLACEARLKYTDYLEEQEQLTAAMSGLAFTIQKFPQEGRYVPPMLDRLEKIAAQVEGADQQLLAFYQLFLPKIQRKRGDSPSKYCMEMYRRGIERFEQSGDLRTAALLKAELAKLESVDAKF